ncbi:MAG: hypothetical protein NTW21_15580 [Verrucomicrobia bacterium]|nr:hypothetical protein [Verrucomicrobiota bacterium]
MTARELLLWCSPLQEPLAAFLARRWGAPITISRQIAAKGNVRAAMADLEMWIGVKGLE